MIDRTKQAFFSHRGSLLLANWGHFSIPSWRNTSRYRGTPRKSRASAAYSALRRRHGRFSIERRRLPPRAVAAYFSPTGGYFSIKSGRGSSRYRGTQRQSPGSASYFAIRRWQGYFPIQRRKLSSRTAASYFSKNSYTKRAECFPIQKRATLISRIGGLLRAAT